MSRGTVSLPPSAGLPSFHCQQLTLYTTADSFPGCLLPLVCVVHTLSDSLSCSLCARGVRETPTSITALTPTHSTGRTRVCVVCVDTVVTGVVSGVCVGRLIETP